MISLPNVFDSLMKGSEKVLSSSYDDYEISSVTILSRQQKVALGSVSGAILIVTYLPESKHTKLRGHKGIVTALISPPNKNLLISGGTDSKIRLWNTDNWINISTIIYNSCTTGGVIHLHAFKHHNSFASIHSERGLNIWSMRRYECNQKLLAFPKTATDRPISHFSITDDGIIACGVVEETDLYMWRIATNRLLASRKGFRGAMQVALDPLKRFLLISFRNREVRAFSIAGLKLMYSINTDSRVYLVGVRVDGMIMIWERDGIKYSVLMKKNSGLEHIHNFSVSLSETFFVVTLRNSLSLVKSV